jgi:hypothetical protein
VNLKSELMLEEMMRRGVDRDAQMERILQTVESVQNRVSPGITSS